MSESSRSGTGEDPQVTFGNPSVLADRLEEGDWMVISFRHTEPTARISRGIDQGEEWTSSIQSETGEHREIAGEVTEIDAQLNGQHGQVEIILTPAGEVKPYLLAANRDGPERSWNPFQVHVCQCGVDKRFLYLGVLERVESHLTPAGDRDG